MEALDRIQNTLNSLDTKKFYQYLAVSLGIIALLAGGIVFQYYRSMSVLKKRVKRVNQYRLQAQEILERAQEVVEQREEVDELLAKDTDFKIGGYFKNVLAKLQLAQKEKMETTQTLEREDEYIEHSLSAKFVDMNMKDLTLLLEEIEGNPRIYTRELEIKRSEKTPGTIDVTLVIATLLPTAVTA